MITRVKVKDKWWVVTQKIGNMVFVRGDKPKNSVLVFWDYEIEDEKESEK